MTERENEYLENCKDTDARLRAERVVRRLCVMWKLKFIERKMKWDQDPGWPAKFVETTFMLYGHQFSLGPTDIGLSSDGWDQGFMESVQGIMEKDLEREGAIEIHSYGFID